MQYPFQEFDYIQQFLRELFVERASEQNVIIYDQKLLIKLLEQNSVLNQKPKIIIQYSMLSNEYEIKQPASHRTPSVCP